MLDYARPAPGEAFDRAIVTVVFLRMTHRPDRPPVVLPPGVTLRPERLYLAEYRALYNEIGADWLWWLRRIMPDDLLIRHLAKPSIAIYVLRVAGEVAGFFETDTGNWPFVNLNYFGLKKEYLGKGLGKLMLDAAIDSVFQPGVGVRAMTLNTCSADHPRALPNYLAAGFREVRRIQETWDVPCRLGIHVAEHLRG
jgi:GNAT superfamily N-acetyltransferase